MTQISSETNNYDGTVFFDTPTLTAIPNECTPQAVFTCTYMNGPYTGALDLCSFSLTNGQYSSAATFSPTTGALTFVTTDRATFPPGTYRFSVEADIYGQTMTSIFDLILTDACETATLSIGTNPFVGSFEYVLGSGFYSITYDENFLVTSDTAIDCGAPTLSFLTETNQAIDGSIFFEDRSSSGAWIFRIGFSDDINKAGNYRLKWRFHFASQPSVFIESPIFEVDVIDLCDPPTGYTQPTLTVPSYLDLEYTITDFDSYNLLPFVVSPPQCQGRVQYTFASNPSLVGAGGNLATFTSQGVELDLYYVGSTDLAGSSPGYTDYTCTITATIGQVTDSQTFNLRVKNPCMDPAYLQISNVAIPDIFYLLASNTGNQWNHQPFVIQGGSQVTSICGGLGYTVNEGALDAFITYTEPTKQFSIYLDQLSFLDNSPYPYTVKAYLTDYPSVMSPTSTGQITLIDPCTGPSMSVIGSLQQSAFTDYSFPVNFAFPTYTVSPSVCESQAVFTCQVDSTVQTVANSLCQSFVLSMGSKSTTLSAQQTGSAYAWSFSSNDNVSFPPGNYVFTITSTIGQSYISVQYLMTIIDPCPISQISLVAAENSFANGPFQYVLNEASATEITWNNNAIAQTTSVVDCGALVFEFLTSTNAAIDTQVFTDDRSVDSAYKFQIGTTSDITKAK